jgi:hypothetical protein
MTMTVRMTMVGFQSILDRCECEFEFHRIHENKMDEMRSECIWNRGWGKEERCVCEFERDDLEMRMK